MTRKFLLCACLLFGQALASGAESYRFSRAVEWLDGSREELLAVPLDSRIYAATRDGFPDLRLVDQDGIETPYLLEKAAGTRTVISRLGCISKLLSLKKQAGKRIEIILSLDDDAESAGGLTVFTPLTNFEHRLQVFGSIDGRNWLPLVRDADIFDYSNYMAVSNRDIVLPANNYRQFRVIVGQVTQTRESEVLALTRILRGEKEIQRREQVDLHRIPLRIERIEFWRNQIDVVPETEKTFNYPVAGFKVTQDNENRQTIVDVAGLREPLTGFTLKTSTGNFNRQASVQIPVSYGIETRMQDIGSAELESLHFREINREQTAVTFPEQRHSSYRIIIRNQDNPPLAISGLSGFGNGYNLLFLPVKGKVYSLRYGSEQATVPSYETGPIRELLRRGYVATPVALAPESAAVADTQALDVVGLLNSKFFLGTVIGLMVAVLIWSLLRIGKRIEHFPK